MSMPKNPVKGPVVYVRKKIKTKRLDEVVGNFVTSSAQQDKEIGQHSFENLHEEPNKYLEEKRFGKKEAKTKRGTKSSNTSKSLDTRQCKGRGAANAKMVANQDHERCKTRKPQTSDFSKYNQILTTEEETYQNQLSPVYGNADYLNNQFGFAKDLGETAQGPVHTNLNSSLQFPPPTNVTCWSTYNAKGKGKEVYEENNNAMDFAEFYAERGNKGITIREGSLNSGSEEMTKLLASSNHHWNQDEYFVSNSMDEMNVWPRPHKPRIVVHPSKIVTPSTFSQNSDQNIQRTSGSATSNFSFMKLLMEDDDSSIMNEEFVNVNQFVSTQASSSEGQRVQQSPCSQVGNYQFENSLQQSCEYQALQLAEQVSFTDLLTREDLSFVLGSFEHVF